MNKDVIVVGCGNAAMVAALSAHENGANVQILEAAPEAYMGGNSRFTFGGFRFGFNSPREVFSLIANLTSLEKEMISSHPYSANSYLRDLLQLSEGQADKALCKMLAENSYSVLCWMKDHGVKWGLYMDGLAPDPLWRRSPGNVYAVGRGKGLVATLLNKVQKSGIPIFYSHRLDEICLDEEGCVEGLMVNTPSGKEQFSCRAVILACGGFEANKELRKKFLGPSWEKMKVRGTAFNLGKGITAAIEVGALPFGPYNNAHGVPLASDAPDYGSLELGETTRRCLFQYGISVNRSGKRFMDEGENKKTFMYSKTGAIVASQEAGIVYQIFDSRVLSANFEKDFYFAGSYKKADTLAELADQLELDKNAFLEEIKLYNHSVEDESKFDPMILDGSKTSGISPHRSNYATKICSPPFFAFKVNGGITFTYGGLRIDNHCRILKQGLKPIPGLFGAGELTGGFFTHSYPANAGLMRGATTGFIVGRSVGEYIS